MFNSSCTTPGTLGVPGPIVLSTAQYLFAQPLPIPGFIRNLNPGPSYRGNFGGCILIEIFESQVWEAGDTAESLGRDIPIRFRLVLDDQTIPTNTLTFERIGPLIIEHDKSGKLLGTHGGISSICIPTSLSQGLHLAKVQVSQTSGKTLFYEWSFSIG